MCAEVSSPYFLYTLYESALGRLLGFLADYGGKFTQAFKAISIYCFYYILMDIIANCKCANLLWLHNSLFCLIVLNVLDCCFEATQPHVE